MSKSGTPIQKRWAKAIYPWRKNGNYLLAVLLIGNVLTNNTVAILMEQLTDGITSIVASTASITVFGEIIPQAVCGRNPLWTGYWTLPITMTFYCKSPVLYMRACVSVCVSVCAYLRVWRVHVRMRACVLARMQILIYFTASHTLQFCSRRERIP